MGTMGDLWEDPRKIWGVGTPRARRGGSVAKMEAPLNPLDIICHMRSLVPEVPPVRPQYTAGAQ